MKNIIIGLDPDGRKIASVLVPRHYEITNCNQLVECDAVLEGELQYYDGIEYVNEYKPSLLKRDMDMYLWREYTDIIIQGVARTETLQSHITVRFHCLSDEFQILEEISVTGDRIIETGFPNPSHSPPSLFNEMPMRFDKAYGGTDIFAERNFADSKRIEMMKKICGPEEYFELSKYSYPRNPSGKGYLIEKEGAEGLLLPNLEFPNERFNIEEFVQPLNKWGVRPYPACWDWFPHAWFPRCAFFMDFPETHNGQIPTQEQNMFPPNIHELSIYKRPKYRFSQGSHPYLQRYRLKGTEEFSISHMSPNGNELNFTLPHHPLRIVIDGENVPPLLDLVFINTEERKVALVWRGTINFDEQRKEEDLQVDITME